MNPAAARPRRVLVVGGGTAAWYAAATLAHTLPAGTEITVLEAPAAHDSAVLQPATPTFPAFAQSIAALGIDERGWLRATQGAFRLGDSWENGHGAGDYLLPLGETGAKFASVPFLQQWLRLRAAGERAAFTDHSLAAVAARLGRFSHPAADPRSVLSVLRYGWHLDSAACGNALRAVALRGGVRLVSGPLESVQRREPDGFVSGVSAAGRRLEADLFLDCSGDAALLAGTAENGWRSWQNWFPCDRLLETRAAASPQTVLLTSRSAATAGWSWNIATRASGHRGLVYCSAHLADADAARELGSEALSAPRAFTSGRRERFWDGNVVALGLAACCIEPLRGTDLLLLQNAVSHLVTLFPAEDGRVESREYNRVVGEMLERVRDYALLPYVGAARADTPFWQYFASLEMPEALAYKMAQFRARGRVVLGEEESFDEADWTASLVGLGVMPGRFDPLAESVPLPNARATFERLRELLQKAAGALPTAPDYLDRYLA